MTPQDGSKEGLHCMYLWSDMENYPLIIPVTLSNLELCYFFMLHIWGHMLGGGGGGMPHLI